MKDEITLLDYWRMVWKYRLMIAGIFFIFTIAALIYSLKLPATYRATASILSSAGISEGAASPYNVMAYYGMMSNSDIFISLLRSRTLRNEVKKKLEGTDIFKKDGFKSETGQMTIFVPPPEAELTNENIINISIVDADPERAALIANAYVEALDRFYVGFNVKEAGQKRRFIEERLKETEESLKAAESRLESYSVKHKIAGSRYSSPDIAGGELGSQLIAKKSELEAKKHYTTPNNPDIVRLNMEIKEIEKTIAGIPSLENEMARLIRDLKVQENVYQLLTEQYEQAKIEEVRNLPTVKVLDWAVPPDMKDGPNVKKNVFFAGFVGLFIGIFLAFLLDYINIQRAALTSKT
ncbi:MAG TPA: Wzz/FepE/Etk N-terminal domain-containing protein [bacterium]|nr:Wzz/FepE/Etk N-terminal domain-containing protein [bacterium]